MLNNFGTNMERGVYVYIILFLPHVFCFFLPRQRERESRYCITNTGNIFLLKLRKSFNTFATVIGGSFFERKRQNFRSKGHAFHFMYVAYNHPPIYIHLIIKGQWNFLYIYIYIWINSGDSREKRRTRIESERSV